MNVKSFLTFMCVPLAVVLMGCSSDEQPEVVRQPSVPQLLTFDVSDEGGEWSTRGTPLNELDGSKYVGLLCTDYDASQASPEVSMMMYNELTFYAGSVWSTSYAYFIPETTHRMRFYAYYPRYDDISQSGSAVRMSDTTEVSAPYFDYVTPTKAEEQQDLMFAVSEEVKSKYVSGALKMDPVKLQFHHLLGALKFTAKSKVAGTVTRVAVSGVKYMGRFVFDGNAQNDWAVLYNEPTDPSKTVWQDFGIRVGASGGEVIIITEEPEVFMLLPQTLGPANKVSVTFETGGNTFTLEKSLPENTLIEKGKVTTVNVSINSLKQVTLSVDNPAITDWNNTNINGEASDNSPVSPVAEVDQWQDQDARTWDTTPTD